LRVLCTNFWDENVVAMCQGGNYLFKGVTPNLHEELNRIPTSGTSEAVVKLLGWADAETGGLILMKRAKPHVVLAALA
jgi:hypothetical protein